MTTVQLGLRRHGGRPGQLLAGLVSEKSESPGESWTRLMFHLAGLPQPEQQVVIVNERGHLVARVDFLYADAKIVIEFDGIEKYAGADGRAALAKEKAREDELRRLGYEVIRLVWADLADPKRFLALVDPVRRRVA